MYVLVWVSLLGKRRYYTEELYSSNLEDAVVFSGEDYERCAEIARRYSLTIEPLANAKRLEDEKIVKDIVE